MTKAPDRTIRELTAELYERFGCAGAPRAKTAKLLEQIDLAADEMIQQVNRLRGWSLVLEVKFAEETGMTDREVEEMRQYYLRPGDLPEEPE